MKIECSLDKIKTAITQTNYIANKNLSLPILSSILLIASGRSLKLRSTNLSLGIEIEIPAKVEKEGVIAVEGSVLLNTISNIFGDPTVFLEGEINLNIITKKINLTIKGQPYEDFPTIPIVSGEKYTIPAKKFIEGIRSVYYSAALSDIKPEISSVYLYSENSDFVFVATDSFRLAEKRLKIKTNADFQPVIIPIKNIVEIMKILDGVSEDIVLIASKNQISISHNTVYITSRVIDGTFPNYQLIIPKEIKTEAIMLRQELASALKLSSIFSDKLNQITLTVAPKEKKFELQAENNDIGRTVSTFDATLSGETISVGLNHRYVSDFFQSITDDSVVISFAGAGKPMLLRGVGDKSFLYLVMPMNR